MIYKILAKVERFAGAFGHFISTAGFKIILFLGALLPSSIFTGSVIGEFQGKRWIDNLRLYFSDPEAVSYGIAFGLGWFASLWIHLGVLHLINTKTTFGEKRAVVLLVFSVCINASGFVGIIYVGDKIIWSNLIFSIFFLAFLEVFLFIISHSFSFIPKTDRASVLVQQHFANLHEYNFVETGLGLKQDYDNLGVKNNLNIEMKEEEPTAPIAKPTKPEKVEAKTEPKIEPKQVQFETQEGDEVKFVVNNVAEENKKATPMATVENSEYVKKTAPKNTSKVVFPKL